MRSVEVSRTMNAVNGGAQRREDVMFVEAKVSRTERAESTVPFGGMVGSLWLVETGRRGGSRG